MTTYTTTTLPGVKNTGLSAQLTDVSDGSKIDIIRLLGSAASKVIINVPANKTIDIVLNSATRRVVPFKAGVVDVDGNTSTYPEFGYGEVDPTTGITIPVIGADNVPDRITVLFGSNPGSFDIQVADGTQSAVSVWNSYETYGELPITSIEVATDAATLTCTFIR